MEPPPSQSSLPINNLAALHNALLPVFAAYDYMGVFQKGHNDAGDVIDVTLVPLLQSQLAAAKQKGSNYHWVVIMAGINDLGAGNYTAAAIMPKLVQVGGPRVLCHRVFWFGRAWGLGSDMG